MSVMSNNVLSHKKTAHAGGFFIRLISKRLKLKKTVRPELIEG